MALLFRMAFGTALLGACLTMAACTHGDESASLEQSVALPSVSRQQMMALVSNREPSLPIAVLPDAAGKLQIVRTHDYVNGLRQDILLAGGSVRGIQDSITILARTNARATLDEQVPLFKPTEAAIRSEIAAQFPHIAMQVAERDSHNAYGPYGLALGRAGGDTRCLYMWQWIDANRLPQEAGVMGPVSVRVRLCQSGTTFDAMASLVDRMAIGASAVGVAADDHGVAAPESAGRADVSAVDPASPRHAARRRVASRRPSTRIAKQASSADGVTAPLMAPSQPRFMGDGATTTARAPQMQQGAEFTPAKLSSDLPPEAYLGPKASKPY